MTARVRGVFQPITLLYIGAAVSLAFISLYPTFFLFYGSIRSAPLGVAGHFTGANYLQVYSDPETYRLVANTLIFATGASGLSVTFALALAWITVRTDAPFRGLLELTAVIPNVMPSLLVAISWVTGSGSPSPSTAACGASMPGDRTTVSTSSARTARTCGR